MKPQAITTILAALGLAGVGCASHPPQELLDARAAYEAAKTGPAKEYNPAQLDTAQKSLQLAENTYEEEGDSSVTRDRAYVAERKAQIATVQARIVASEQRLAKLDKQQREKQASELDQARSDLRGQRVALAEEQQRRAEAEKRAEQAAADLARIADVKQESRGMVITLSGNVLFASGKSELLGSAQAKLSEVAQALTQTDPDAAIVVEGHTDSQGSATFNQELSTHRAEAVRDYLASHGVAQDRIRAEGRGFSSPLADNKTAEGRANNRRVEIVVQPAAGASARANGSPAPATPTTLDVRE
jgi:outer membrane protein OmpA-like peptidoglycan-associated protein